MKYAKVARKLLRLGCFERARTAGTSHRRWINQSNGKFTVVPEHGGREIDRKLLKNIVKQLGLSWDEFMNA